MDIKIPKGGGNNTPGINEPPGASNTSSSAPATNDKFAALISHLGEQINAGASPAAGKTWLGTTRAALAQIASSYNLSSAEEATAAVRRSARLLITTRLEKNLLGKPQTEEMIENLSEHVASDPLMKGKLLKILERVNS